MTTETLTISDEYTITLIGGFYHVARNGTFLTDKNGAARRFVSRNAARKRISRERTGQFHK